MAYDGDDDIASSCQNPSFDKLFNRDVDDGFKMDGFKSNYKAKDVTPTRQGGE